MPDPIIIVIPGRQFQFGVESLRQELRSVLLNPGVSLPISRLFEFIELTEGNQSLKDNLLRRGSFVRDTSNTFENIGRTIDQQVYDIGPELSGIGLYISRTVKINATFVDDIVRVTPIDSTRILLIFDKPPAPGYGQRFVLDGIEGRLERWIYRFHEDLNPINRIEIVVDMTLSLIAKVQRKHDDFHGRRLSVVRELRPASSALTGGGCECNCCSSPKKRDCPPGNVNLELKLRCFVLLDNNERFATFQQSVHRQIDAMISLYATCRITINVVAITEVTDPAFLIINPGDCVRGRVSPDTNNLFQRYWRFMQPGEVAAFVVRQVVGLAGCASHPDGQRGFIMDRTIGDPRDSVMGHELGHVLSLNHVPDRKNLMWGTDGNPIIDPPPDLYADQVDAIRCNV